MPNHRQFTIFLVILLCAIACTPEKSFVIVKPGQLVRFYNADSTLYGFKNHEGEIIVDTVFSKDKNSVKIVSAKEINNGYDFYHVTYDGRIVARDSVYLPDLDTDCENEGHIRFWDKKKRDSRTGLLNAKGEVVIPAVYSDMEPSVNGLVNCLEGAKLKNIEGEIYRYVGGHHVLRDTLGTILIKNFEPKKGTPYFCSLRITDAPDPDPLRESFKTTKGNYYSFLILEKEMEQWFFNHFCIVRSLVDLKKLCFEEVSFNGSSQPVTSDCLTENEFKEIKESTLTSRLKPRISIWGLPSFDREKYKAFFDYCGKYKQSKYPVLNVNYEDIVQYEFIYTSEGFKLSGVYYY
nr:WG repeat-containing protein [uncultured Flavobacterium sp.]